MRYFTALVQCYPEDVYRERGIRLAWLDAGDRVDLKIEDEYGRTSTLAITNRMLYGMTGGELAERIDQAVSWHLEPPPFYVP